MKRREFLTLLLGAASWPMATSAQQADRLPKIGTLLINTAEQERAFFGNDPFGFGDLGYVEGKNIEIVRRFADGRPERLPQLAAELVALKVDVIVTAGEGVFAAHSATTTIPIVMALGPDVVAFGYAASLAHPGGNVTGITSSWEFDAKRLELLKEVAPSMRSIGVLLLRGDVSHQPFIDLMAPVAKSLNVELRTIEVSGKGYAEALSAAGPIEGLMIVDAGQFQGDAAIIVAAATARRLPTAASPLSARAGALIGYGIIFQELFRHAAIFVDKILKGTKAGDIPIERNTRFHTTVNLKTAAALGLEVPPSVLAAADEVIE